MLRKIHLVVSTFLIYLFFAMGYALAHCPLCTAATGAAVATSRWLGVDDLATGVFVGGLIISTSLWFNNILKRGNKNKEYISYQSLLIFSATLGSIIIGFYFLGIIGEENYFRVFGIDKMLIGISVGIGASVIAFQCHDFLRKNNSNRNYIPLQSIIILLLFLTLVSLSFYAIGWAV